MRVEGTMENKKLSRTVRKRLNKKAKLQSSASRSSIEVHPAQVRPAPLPQEQIKQKQVVQAKHSKPALKTTSKHPKRNPENRVVYINSNYRGDDPNGVGSRIQAELIGLRKESKNIKTASDLTESQAHVVKRQITRLQGAVKEKKFKRPENCSKTIGEATKELMFMIEKQQNKRVNKSTNIT